MNTHEFRFRKSIFDGYQFGKLDGTEYVRRISDGVMVAYKVLNENGAYRKGNKPKFDEVFERIAAEETFKKLQNL